MNRFRVEVISCTPNPQQTIYAAMHQDYSESFVVEERDRWPAEEQAGEVIVKRLLAGERGHYGPLEHAMIVFNVGYFPHSVMQQARTHRIGVSFDVQCLAGETEITFVTASGGLRKIPIAQLYDLWTYGEQTPRLRQIKGRKGEAPGLYRRDCRQRLKKMRLRVLNEETGIFETSHIKDVMCSGVQPVYRLTFEDGRQLDCTTNHRLLTPDGWKIMADAVGLEVDSNGKVRQFQRGSTVLANGVLAAGLGLYRDRHWLQAQIDQGQSVRQIAAASDCSETTIRQWIKRHGLVWQSSNNSKFYPGQHPWNDNPSALYRQRSWLEDQLRQGLYSDQIAAAADCSVECIKKWVYRHGLSLNRRPPFFIKGMTPWNAGQPGYRLNLSPESREQRRHQSLRLARRGEKSNFWKGGVSSERTQIAAWTRQIAPLVHERYNYTCQCCGKRGSSAPLHAHHLVPVYADASLGYSLDNLVTLCKDCHEQIHHQNREAEFARDYQPIEQPVTWPEKPRPQSRRLRAHPLKVVGVTYLGLQMTYDLEVEEPWHNFVANGLVVHNSMRYTGQRVADAAVGKIDLEEIFYLRPVGQYLDRQGKKYTYTETDRAKDLELCRQAALRYQELLEAGYAEEHARGILPFDYRQHFVVSFTLRSLMHFLDLRSKKDAQIEIQQLCDLLWPHFQTWAPAIAQWYASTRLGKARLAP